MKKITLILLLLSTLLSAEEIEKPSAVSKVMARFSKLSTIESTPIEESSMAEEQSTTTQEPVLNSREAEELEIVETIKTAKFEEKDIAYPQSGIVDRTEVEKVESTEKPKDNNLAELEADAKRVIEEEMKKVEEAKQRALEKINEAMKRVEDAKKNKNEF
jgi:hypothetical protein